MWLLSGEFSCHQKLTVETQTAIAVATTIILLENSHGKRVGKHHFILRIEIFNLKLELSGFIIVFTVLMYIYSQLVYIHRNHQRLFLFDYNV